MTGSDDHSAVGDYVWRFGYGSNIGRQNLEKKKNLNPSRFLVGTIPGWDLHIGPGMDHVEPGFAGIHPVHDCADTDKSDGELHGSAFLIPRAEAEGLDTQERAYHVLPSRFTSYEGEVVEGVGLYVPKKFLDGDGNIITTEEIELGVASLRYLTLIRKGAEEAGLSEAWIRKLYSFEHYVTPADMRSKTNEWIEEFHCDVDRKDNVWTVEHLAKHDGSDPECPAHVAVMEYVVKLAPNGRIFPSWKGHCITRRNLLHFNGKSIDSNDIRWNEPGFRPLPVVAQCTDAEKEYLMQNLERLLHNGDGGTIVGRLKEYLEDQEEFLSVK